MISSGSSTVKICVGRSRTEAVETPGKAERNSPCKLSQYLIGGSDGLWPPERGSMDEENREDEEYRAAVREFYEVYYKAKREYNLCMSSSSSVYDDSKMEIYRFVGNKKELVIRLTAEEDIVLYKRAREEVLRYEQLQSQNEIEVRKAV